MIINAPLAANDIAIDRNGDFIVAGSLTHSSGPTVTFGMARIRPNGSLDSSFGFGGIVSEVVGTRLSEATSIALQPDGKIVVAGIATAPFNLVAVTRLNPDGAPDLTFGHGGRRSFAFVPGQSANTVVALLQPDGKILIGGGAGTLRSPAACIARLESDGTFDPAFGRGGIAVLPVVTDITNLALQADGKIAFSGTHFTPIGSVVSIGRVLADGELDPSNTAGTVMSSAHNSVQTFAAQSDLVYASRQVHVVNGGPDGDVQMERFLFNGRPRTGFSSPAFDFGPEPRTAQTDQAQAVRLDGMGRIVVAGVTPDQFGNVAFGLARVNANGSLDTGFGTQGRLITSFLGDDVPHAIAIQRDGKVVVAGQTTVQTTTFLCLARYVGQ